MKKERKAMTVADGVDGKWRVVKDFAVLASPDSMEEAVFMLSCLGYTPVKTVEYREYNCTIVWTNDFFDVQMNVYKAGDRWVAGWDRHYKIASFPDMDSAFEWVRNSFDGEKTFRKKSDAEYTVRFRRKT